MRAAGFRTWAEPMLASALPEEESQLTRSEVRELQGKGCYERVEFQRLAVLHDFVDCGGSHSEFLQLVGGWAH